ncbi:MAG: hypothetical protein IJI51_08345 [Lachnospiraceae bacterium]|nr:hypothetical protein [Lachnospiraceae bacterium]
MLFEMVPINYRPVLIEGRLEASYPSSTTLLVLSVMPTLKFQADRRIDALRIKNAISIFTIAFSIFMVEEFDKGFPAKEKKKLPGQIFES